MFAERGRLPVNNLSVVIAGVGGQGTVLLSRLIGNAALTSGQDVRGAETIGMAQRGGSVVSHVRIGADTHSPLTPSHKADLLLAFEPGEAVRAFHLLADNAAVVALDRAVKPSVPQPFGEYDGASALAFLKENVSRLYIIEQEKLFRQISPKAANVALFGAAVGLGLLPLSIEQAKLAVRERVPEKFLSINLNALDVGANYFAEVTP
jgi:indolepyruvate ferredoxin oxidoreductase beta subunit